MKTYNPKTGWIDDGNTINEGHGEITPDLKIRVKELLIKYVQDRNTELYILRKNVGSLDGDNWILRDAIYDAIFTIDEGLDQLHTIISDWDKS